MWCYLCTCVVFLYSLNVFFVYVLFFYVKLHFPFVWTLTGSSVFMFVFCVLQGISFLEMKHQLLLSYLTNLTFVMLKKVQGQSIQGDEAVERLVEIRTVSCTNNIESICVYFRFSCFLKSYSCIIINKLIAFIIYMYNVAHNYIHFMWLCHLVYFCYFVPLIKSCVDTSWVMNWDYFRFMLW